MAATIDLSEPDDEWRADPHPPGTVCWPTREYEGGNLPLETSGNGLAREPTRALRDPAVLEDGGQTYLYYAVAGEHGIAGAELRDDQ